MNIDYFMNEAINQAKNVNKTKWDYLICQFDGTNLDNIRNFLIRNKVKEKVETLAERYFNSAYNELSNLGFDKGSEIYKFFKIIQERHS